MATKLLTTPPAIISLSLQGLQAGWGVGQQVFDTQFFAWNASVRCLEQQGAKILCVNIVSGVAVITMVSC